MHLTPGSRFGAYEVIAAIGRGGMGEVFRVRDLKLGRDVALKVLPSDFGTDTERRHRFEREAKILASLNHPNIAAIYGYEDVDGVQGLVLELVEGPTLGDRIARGALSPVEALQIATQIAEAVETAHNAGIIHRDLKPANVKVTSDGRVKVLDFGLARALGLDERSVSAESPTIANLATQPGVVLGTPAYMSPEQARGMVVDKRADVWAFGCVLYEMLAGTRAFGGDNASDTMVSVMTEEPKWHSLPAETSASVLRLLRRCLVKDPRARLRDLGDAQLDLREALAPRSIDDVARSGSDTGRRRRVVPWVAMVITTGLAGLAVWSVMRPAEVPTAPAERLTIALPATAPVVGSHHSYGVLPGSGVLAISRDGRTVVYVGPREDRRTNQLYVRSLDAYDPRPLVGTDGAAAPFFSPDGQTVGFFAAGRLLRTSLGGGGIATICNAREDAVGSGGTWGPDDTIVFAAPTSAREGLRIVSAYGGTPEILTTPDPVDGGGHGDPAFMPGSSAVLFTSRATKAGVPPSIMVHSLATGQHHKLIEGDARPMYAATGHLVFMRGSTIAATAFRSETLEVSGRVTTLIEQVADFEMSVDGRIVYLAQPNLGGQLVWVDRHGSAAPISDQDQRFGRPRLSPDGSLLVAEVFRPTGMDIAAYRFSNRALTLLTTDGASNSPEWHPDGRSIVFRAPGQLVLQSVDGSGSPEVLLAASDPALRSTSSLAPGVYSDPAGSTFTFAVHGSADTGADIFSLHIDDRRIEPLVERPGNQWAVRVSPDGKWISYASDESGRFEVYIEPPTGGQARFKVSTGGGSQAVWSRAGDELFYRIGDNMMAVPITNDPDSPVGTPKLLFTGHYASTDLPHYDVTADGQHFVMIKPIVDDLDDRTIRVVDGWSGELERRGASSR